MENRYRPLFLISKGENSFSSDHLKDITVCQKLYKEMDSFSKQLKGYIQNINYIPFGFLMQCETQVQQNLIKSRLKINDLTKIY